MTTIISSSVSISSCRAVLRDAGTPDCSLAIWRRCPPFDATSVVDNLKANIRSRIAVRDLRRDLPAALAGQGGLEGRQARMLTDDIAQLAADFSAALSIDELEFRLEIVETNSCRKFHADYTRARLITTYVGSGTQWLTAEDAARVAGGEEPLTVNSLVAGDVGIFRGKLGDGPPAIHRSPPIAGTGERRLLMVLNSPKEGSAWA